MSLALENGDHPVVTQGPTTVREDFPDDVLAAFEDRHGRDPRTPYGADPRRCLPKVRVTRRPMAGTDPESTPSGTAPDNS